MLPPYGMRLSKFTLINKATDPVNDDYHSGVDEVGSNKRVAVGGLSH